MGRGAWWQLGVVAWLGAAAPALAQSEALREEVRLQHEGAAALAQKELAACRASTRSCADADRLGLLTGTLLLSHGELDEARRVLEATRAQGLLGPHRTFALGQALFYLREPGQAAVQFAAVAKSGSPPLAARARTRLGEALLAAGKAQEALPLLDAAVKASTTPELLIQRARALHAVGRSAEAKADLTRIALEHPVHPLAHDAEQDLKAIDGKPWKPSAMERLGRAERLTSAGSHRGALSEAEAIRPLLPKAELPRLSLLEARAKTALGQAAEPAWRAALAGPENIAAAAGWDRARQAMRGSDREAARKAMRAFHTRHPKDRQADDALYFLAWLHLQDGQHDEAVKAFDEFFEKHRDSSLRDDAAWFQALARIEQKDFKDAQQRLDAFVKAYPGSQLVPQARYWAIRVQQLANPKAEVAAAYEALIRDAPETWYALLAGSRLHELGKKPPAGFPEVPRQRKVIDAASLPSLDLARELSSAALFPEASEEVAYRIRSVKGAKPALELGHALAGIELHGEAYALATRHLWGQAYTRKDPEALALLYPRAYPDSVEQGSKRASVEPSFVWAIMRRESAFRPSALSHADARGLMQLIPPTAQQIAKTLGEAAPAPADLFSPGVNVRYASWYLGKLMERFGHPALAAAAYNGGPNAVARWVKQSGTQPLDLFVEKIPYKETRRYVKKVLSDAHLYRAFYGSDSADGPPLQLQLPAPTGKGVDF